MFQNIKKLQRELKDEDIDFALFYRMSEARNANILYFSGYEGHGFLVIPKNKPPFLIVPATEIGLAKKTGIKAFKIGKEGALKNIKKVIKRFRKVGVDEKNFSIYAFNELKKHFRNIRISGINKTCYEIRAIKTEEEIKNYIKATRITDILFDRCIKNFKRFKSEEEVSEFLKEEAVKFKCEPSFEYIIASGKNSSFIHHKPKGKLRKGFCIIDFGIRYKNICTDMTRTIYIGKPTMREKNIYNNVLKAQIEAIKHIKAGIKFSEIFNIVKENLGKNSNKFTHSLGHGIGYEIHEYPNISMDSKQVIKEGMIFTIEPGVYFKNKFGIRIEDDVLVSKNRAIILTKSPKDLITVD